MRNFYKLVPATTGSDLLLFLRLETCSEAPCSDPGWPGTGPSGDARYKWFLDTTAPFARVSGQTVVDYEWMVAVEDPGEGGPISNDGRGEIALYRYSPGPPVKPELHAGPIAAGAGQPRVPNCYWGDTGEQVVLGPDFGYRILGDYVDMYVRIGTTSFLGTPSTVYVLWATDQEGEGNLEQLQAQLGFRRLPPGSTIAFHYIDPNDFDDVAVAVIHVGDRPRSQVFVTDSTGNPVTSLDLAYSGLYVKVLDPNASVQACCSDTVLVAICNPHNEGDCEYVILDETSSTSGVFFTHSAIPLVPVWDAIGGYQRVFDDWRVQAYNEDTLLVWYASVGYLRVDINALGDGNARR